MTRPYASSGDSRVVVVLAAMLLLVPALGVPSELVLQDTLKSALVALGTLLAALLLCWQRLRQPEPMRWHGLLWLPLLLMAWALGSMAWSHAYLAGVEAVRWAVFALLLWLGLQVLRPDHLPVLAQGIHWGAVMAALWAGLQFWTDLRLFPQAAMPGSTFSNRNFFAEYLVCCVPFSLWMAAQSRGLAQLLLRCALLALVVLAIVLTGTRSALLATLVMLPALALVLWRQRAQLAWPGWSRAQQALALGVTLGVFIGLGSVPAGNAQMLRENPGRTALERSLWRVETTLAAQDPSAMSSVQERLSMWQSNRRLIQAHPWTGVGAGAWEIEIPRFQPEGMEIEEDYYAHNEPLQLLAEYGLAGWIFLLALVAYLLRSAWTTWHARTAPQAIWRALALTSLLGLLVVSLAGFPWRLAGTGALLAVALAVLAATDERRAPSGPSVPGAAGPGSRRVWALAWLLSGLALVAGVWLGHRAYASETRLVRAAQMAYDITRSGRYDDPAWGPHKAEMLRLLREGVALNPHYRKLTSLLADELLRWGDERNARWVLESLAASRPHVVVILTNLGRLHANAGEMEQAEAYLERAAALQPRGAAVLSLKLLLLRKKGQDDEARRLLRDALARGTRDLQLLNQAYQLALQGQDWPLAISALERRIALWPATAVESWLRLAQIHAQPAVGDEARALRAYRAAVQALPAEQQETLRRQIPQPYRKRL